MPIGAGLAAGLGIAAAVVPSATNAYATGRMNKKNRKFAKEMYATQRADSLADWNMQNDFNNPSAQMSRYKEAGLNPNLIYGQGSDAQTVRPSTMQTPQTEAPQLDSNVGTEALNSYQKVRNDTLQRSILQQNLDNMKAQQELLQAQKLDTLAAVDNKTAGTSSIEIENQLKKSLDENGVRYRTSLGTEIMQSQNIAMNDDLQKNNKTKITQENQLRETTIKKMQAETVTIEQQQRIASFEEKLNKKGLTKQDPTYWRLLSEALDLIIK